MTDHPLKRHLELDDLIADAHRRGDSETERKLRIEKQSLGRGLDQRTETTSDATELMEWMQSNIERDGWAALLSLFEHVSGVDAGPNWQDKSLALNLVTVKYFTHDELETSAPPAGDFSLRFGCALVAGTLELYLSDHGRHVAGPSTLGRSGGVDLQELEGDYRAGRYNTLPSLIAGIEEHVRETVRDHGGLTVKQHKEVERPNALGGLLRRLADILGWSENTTIFVKNLLVTDGSKAVRNYYQHGRFPSREQQRQDMAVLIVFASWLMHHTGRLHAAGTDEVI